MREITLAETKDPVQLNRWLRDMAQRTQEMLASKPAEPAVEYIPVPQREKLPDEVLADLQLTQIARIHNYGAAVTAAPTTADNLAAGYTTGSEWYDSAAGFLYKCVYSDLQTAVWVQIN